MEQLEIRRLLTAAPNPLDLSNLDGENGFRLDGYTAGGYAGWSVNQAGDVNGDDIPDLVIGALHGAAPDRGSAFVVFGRSDGFPATSSLNTLDGTNGFELRASYGGNLLGQSVSGAGDMNGDGFDDVLVSDTFANGRAGSTFVVFGKASGFQAMVDLAMLDGTDGFRINGEASRDQSGHSVSNAGDFNGDGFGDIIIGVSHLPNSHGGSDTPATGYVIFGKTGGFAPVLSLAALDGSNGFSVEDTFQFNRQVSSAGDLNGDGLSDVVIGSGNDGPESSAYVLFGSSSVLTPSINVSQLNGTNGFRFKGGLSIGQSVGHGDFNGDGVDDLLVGNPEYPELEDNGEAFVILGKSGGFDAEITRDDLDGTNGFRIIGAETPGDGADQLGLEVSGIGDFNDDGFDDFILGTRRPNFPLAGGSFVVFGRPSGFGAEFDVTSLDGTNGFRIDGGLSSGQRYRMSGAGDLNGDGYDDLMLSRPAATTSPFLGNEGAVYVIYGSDVGSYSPGVTAELVDGVLEVVGTDGIDQIQISVLFGTTTLTGLDGTTINGESKLTISTGSIPVHVSMGKGSDTVIIRDIFGQLQIDTGAGKDYVEFTGSVAGASSVDTGGGDDHVVIDVIDLSGHFSLDTGNGNDRASFAVSRFLSANIEVSLGKGNDIAQWQSPLPSSIDNLSGVTHGGPGFDRIVGAIGLFTNPAGFEEEIRPTGTDAEKNFVGGNITTEVIDDPAVGRILVVKGNNHFDHDLQLNSTAPGQISLASIGYGATIDGLVGSAQFLDIDRVKVVLGSGSDTVLVNGLWLNDALIVKTGLGNDNVQVVGSQLGRLKIDTDGGADTILVDSTIVERRTAIFAGWGADDVTLSNSEFRRKVLLDGGLDADTLHLLAVNIFNKGLEHDFENLFES
jgi:hypothetical protein